MIKIEARQIFCSNGLIDDLVVYGAPEDYLHFAKIVKSAISSKSPITLATTSCLNIEIIAKDDDTKELFTSLQNTNNEYYSMEEWNERNIVRIIGCEETLMELQLFLMNLSNADNGYSYISEFSENYKYSHYSPEWRFHVENT